MKPGEINKPRGLHVLIVDDSALVRTIVAQVLAREPKIGPIEVAIDPIFARRKLENAWPDVILLDIEMPRMDGITFLKEIMSTRPTPVVVFSTLTSAGAQTTLQALAAGAVDFISKPRIGLKDHIENAGREMATAVLAAASANVNALRSTVGPGLDGKHTATISEKLITAPETANARLKTTQQIVAIGTSAGGTRALETVLTQLPVTAPGILIVQHMPEKFTNAFARRLNQICAIEVREARGGERIVPGLALIAPGDRHLRLRRQGALYFAEVIDGPPVSRHRPSVDVLFRSVAVQAGENALGIIMTGMGDDGVAGLLEMKTAGAITIAQDEATSVVFGMPREAIRRGAADFVHSLYDFAADIMRLHRGD